MTFHVKVAERWGIKSLGMGGIAVAVAAVIGVIAPVSKASAGTVTPSTTCPWWGDSGVSVTIPGSNVFRLSDWSPADHRGQLQRVQRLVHRLQQ